MHVLTSRNIVISDIHCTFNVKYYQRPPNELPGWYNQSMTNSWTVVADSINTARPDATKLGSFVALDRAV